MAISDRYVSEFVPLQEIPRLEPHSSGGLADLYNDDLFLISKLSAEATSTSKAIALSKSLRYQDMKERLSSDMGIQLMKDDIYELSINLSCLSVEVLEKYKELIETISSVSTYLSTDYTEKITELCTLLDSDYVKKYNSDIIVPQGKMISEMHIKDGQLLSGTEYISYIDLSDYINLEGASIAAGTIKGDYNNIETKIITSDLITSVEYRVVGDCYLDISLSVLENDDCNKPLEVYINNIKAYDSSEKPIFITSKIGLFNNPGGFGGVTYYNYYHTSIPVKCKFDDTGSQTTIIIKYSDGSKFIYDEENKSSITFTEYKYYATVAESVLSNYILKDSRTRLEYTLGLYKIKVTDTGLVYDTRLVTHNDLCSIIGATSSTNYGLLKTGYVTSAPNYKLEVSDGNAYTNIPFATSTHVGTVRLTNTITNVQGDLLRLSSDANHIGFVKQPRATWDTYGTIRLSSSYDSSKEQCVVGTNNGRAYALVPKAGNSVYGLVKIDDNKNAPGYIYRDATSGRIRATQATPTLIVDDIYNIIIEKMKNDPNITFIVAKP